jgi:hypothetical protein
MRTLVDLRLRVEAEKFAFRFACDDCAHFDASASTCSLSFEAAPRRDGLESRASDMPLDATHVELCKTFELA